jgi:predicted RNA-binding protein Jag
MDNNQTKPNQTKKMTTTENKLTATEARNFAKRIISETIFTDVKVKKSWDSWEINIDGGSAACYGRTIKYSDSALDILQIFAK